MRRLFRGSRKPALVVGAALVVAAIVAGAFVVSGRGGPVATAPASRATPDGTSVVRAGITWTPYAYPANADQRHVPSSAVPGGAGYVGVCEDGLYCTSPDGVFWTTSKSAPFADPEEHAYLHLSYITRGPTGLVLIGGISWEYKMDLVDSVVFVSGDGRSWRRTPADGEDAPDRTVVVGPAGYVGTKWMFSWGTNVYQSVDAIAWQVAEPRPIGDYVSLWGSSTAYFIATEDPATEWREPALLRSVDGLHWTRVWSSPSISSLVEAPDGSLIMKVSRPLDEGESTVDKVLQSSDGGKTYQVDQWMRSSDGGTTWRRMEMLVDGSPGVINLALASPARLGGLLIAQTSSGIVVSTDGVNWSLALEGLGNSFYPLGDAVLALQPQSDRAWIGMPAR